MTNKILFVVFILIALNQFSYAIDKSIHIEKSDVGYDVYSANKKLLLEFTKTNSDSSELALIKYIYDNQNEIDSEIQDKMIIVNNKAEGKSGWDIAIAIAQIIGVLFTGTVLWFTFKKIKKEEVHNKNIIYIKEKEFQIERNKYLKTIRPEFVINHRSELETSGDGATIKGWYSSVNIGERAYNVSIILDTNENILKDLNIKLCEVDYMECKDGIVSKSDTVRKLGGAAFTLLIPINTPATLVELKLIYSDIDGNKYIQILNAFTDGRFSVSPSTLLE